MKWIYFAVIMPILREGIIMKAKFLAIFGLVLIGNIANANQLVPPVACPTVAALSAVGVNQAVPVENMWVMYQWKDKFGTADDWSLYVMAMGYDQANPAEIIPEINAKLINVKFTEGPVEQHKGNHTKWACTYELDEKDNADVPRYLLAVTLTPPGVLSGNMAQSFMHKVIPSQK